MKIDAKALGKVAVLFGGNWSWVAEITGFATGFLLTFAVSPGGFQRLLDQIRQR